MYWLCYVHVNNDVCRRVIEERGYNMVFQDFTVEIDENALSIEKSLESWSILLNYLVSYLYSCTILNVLEISNESKARF